MIEQGRVSEAEVEHLIIQSLKQPGSEGSEAFKAKTERKMMLETKDLVNALNEHLELRDMGNRLYGWDVYSIHAACAANLLKRRTILFPSIDSYVQVRQYVSSLLHTINNLPREEPRDYLILIFISESCCPRRR